EVRDDADSPAWPVRGAAGGAHGENLFGSFAFVTFAEGAIGERSAAGRFAFGEFERALGAVLGDDHPAVDDRIFAELRHEGIVACPVRSWHRDELLGK